MRAIIVEDEHEMREALTRRIAENCPDIELVGQADKVLSAAKLVKEVKPDLVFLDVELPEGKGFDLLDITDHPVKVIFTTGSNEYAIKAFQYAAIDYLLKPFTTDELLRAVERASDSAPVQPDQVQILGGTMQGGSPDKLALHTSDKIIFTGIEDIIRCEADGNYTHFYITGKPSVLVARTLKEYDKLLFDKGFYRVHQSHLVNVKSVAEFVKTDGGYLVLTDGAKVPVSTRKKQGVLEWLEQNSV